LQVLSLNLFEKTPLFAALTQKNDQKDSEASHNSMPLFDF